jgi:O-methyltransferase
VTLLARLPLFRGYLAEIKRLRRALKAANAEIDRLHAAQLDPQWVESARRYEYLWDRAFKQNDVRDLEPFGTLAATVMRERRTFLNVDRLYTLWQMVQQLSPEATAVAEVGVYKGGSARFIAEALRLRGREIPFYVCDTFGGHAEVDETIDGLHRVGAQFVQVKSKNVRKYLASFPFVRVVEGNIRDTAPAFAAEETFGFVHVDVDVYPITRFCLEFFTPRVVTGGAIVVDDYGSRTCEGVAKAVDEFEANHADFFALHLLSGQAVLIRVS